MAEEGRKKVLMLGNGINRIDNDYSWNQLMQDLLSFAGLKPGEIEFGNKPFPMLYEEIFMRWRAQHSGEESKMKREIARLIRFIKSNALHRKALQLDIQEILTTNYDYNLEATTHKGPKAPDAYLVRSSKYALTRRKVIGKQNIWHIHGDCQSPGNILLGYEQYAGYLQTIRNYVTVGLKFKHIYLEPLNRRLKEDRREVMTWVDHMFLNDVYILGLSMDFTEIHLWWLLNYRARIAANPAYNIRNKVTYIYPSADTPWIKPRIDLLCAYGVKCIALPVVNNDWKGMYMGALEMISRA
jgi:hypothetical protein